MGGEDESAVGAWWGAIQSAKDDRSSSDGAVAAVIFVFVFAGDVDSQPDDALFIVVVDSSAAAHCFCAVPKLSIGLPGMDGLPHYPSNIDWISGNGPKSGPTANILLSSFFVSFLSTKLAFNKNPLLMIF